MKDGAQLLNFFLHETTSHPILVADAHNTRVSSMGSSEGIIDIDVAQFREFLPKGFDGLRTAFYFIAVLVFD